MVGISLDLPSGLRPLMLRQLCIIVTVRHMYLLLRFCSPFNAHWHFLIFFAAEHPPSRGQSIRITVVCSGSCMASFLTPPLTEVQPWKRSYPQLLLLRHGWSLSKTETWQNCEGTLCPPSPQHQTGNCSLYIQWEPCSSTAYPVIYLLILPKHKGL